MAQALIQSVTNQGENYYITIVATVNGKELSKTFLIEESLTLAKVKESFKSEFDKVSNLESRIASLKALVGTTITI
jgi:hypothetical protein